VGEYIRTGLDYNEWLANFKEGLKYTTHRRQMRVDFTLTLPGLFEIENITDLAKELDVDILAKVIFSFSPDIILSPLALPRKLLDKTVDRLVINTTGAMRDILLQLKHRPTFAEQWPDEYVKGLAKGKSRVLQLEKIRGDQFTLADILKKDPEILEWYNEIT
jgi:hypothetical protein